MSRRILQRHGHQDWQNARRTQPFVIFKTWCEKNILVIDIPGAKRPSYSIVYDAEDLTQFFADVTITEEKGIPYLCALFKGKKQVRERLLKLDAERYLKDDLPLSNLLGKYCSYLMAGK